MENFRLILLIIGCFIILGVYLREIFFNAEKYKNSELLEAVDEFPYSSEAQDMPPPMQNKTDNQEAFEHYSEAVANLGSLLAQSRNEHLEDEVLPDNINVKTEAFAAPFEQNIPLNIKVSEDNTLDYEEIDIFSPPEGNFPTTEPPLEDSPDNTNRKAEEKNDILASNQTYSELLVLYILSSENVLFDGLSINKAVDEVGMNYGKMNIFHHFGSGVLHSEEPLFSMANMYEPGSFNLEQMTDLKTKGLAVFMYAPTLFSASVVFELMLNTVQQIATLLGGEVRTATNELLTDAVIKTLRDKTESLSAIRS